MDKNTNNAGFLLLEAVLVIAIIGIAFGILLDMATLSVKLSTAIKQNDQANFLLKEAMESTRNFRDGTTWASNGLGTLNTGSSNPYYFALSNNTWNVTSGTETLGIFTRKVIFDKVSRDPATQNIEDVYNASHDDPDTRKVTVTVATSARTLTLIAYLTHWK